MSEAAKPTERLVALGEVTLSVTEQGSGPLVLLLHGFPDCAFTWRHQLPALAAAGFHAVAPDLRGYGRSSRPRGVASYAVPRLAGDVARLVTALGAERADVVGHDWGGAIAWAFAMLHPERLRRLAILNAPHPVTFRRHLRTLDQLRRSWYLIAFQLPALPELAMAHDDLAAVRAVFRTDPVRAGAFSDADIERHLAALRPPGALTAALNYYRALFRDVARGRAVRPAVVSAAVTVIWGGRDRYLGPGLAALDPRWVPSGRVVRVPDASHWVHHDRPDVVNDELVAFLTRPD